MPEQKTRKPLTRVYQGLRSQAVGAARRRDDFSDEVLATADMIQGDQPVEEEEPELEPVYVDEHGNKLKVGVDKASEPDYTTEQKIEAPPPEPEQPMRKPSTTRNSAAAQHPIDKHFVNGAVNATHFDASEFVNRVKEG